MAMKRVQELDLPSRIVLVDDPSAGRTPHLCDPLRVGGHRDEECCEAFNVVLTVENFAFHARCDGLAGGGQRREDNGPSAGHRL